MADWYNSDGEVNDQGFGGAHLIVETGVSEGATGGLGTGNAGTYTAAGGSPVSVFGVMETGAFTVDELFAEIGRIDSTERYRLRRGGRTLADFPTNPSGSGYGKLTTASQTRTVLGAVLGTSFLWLFLSAPES